MSFLGLVEANTQPKISLLLVRHATYRNLIEHPKKWAGRSMDNPWMKFYTADWRSDPALRMCSMAARGLWVEMICLMHEATPYGQLLI